MSPRTTILGAGAWGTALALHLARKGEPVALWGRDSAVISRVVASRANLEALPGFVLPEAVLVTDQLAPALEDADLIVVAVPSHAVRSVLASVEAQVARARVLIAAKGIEVGTLALMTQVAEEALGRKLVGVAVLSGPSFALEVARQHPTAVVVASRDERLAIDLQEQFATESLRLYTNGDPIGVQVCGAIKNVVAIASGVLVGMDLGANSVAALLTRGLAEIQRLGAAMGARPETFFGLAGVGDLILTATGELSRNRRFGIALGRGRSASEILAAGGGVVEGVRTAQAAAALAAQHGIELPIVEQVRRVLYDGVSPGAAIAELMSRRLRSET